MLSNSLSAKSTAGSRRDVRSLVRMFRVEQQEYLSDVIKHLEINLLSEDEKSLVARYLINKFMTKFSIFGLYKLKGIRLKNIVITLLSEIQRMFKYA